RDTDEQGPPPRGGRTQREGLTEWKAARDQQNDEEQDAIDRDRGDRCRVLEEIIGLETYERPAQAQGVARGGEQRDQKRPENDADGVKRSRQASSCATRSGSSCASARSISSSV